VTGLKKEKKEEEKEEEKLLILGKHMEIDAKQFFPPTVPPPHFLSQPNLDLILV